MIKKYFQTILFIVFILKTTFGQDPTTISGTIIDEKTKEPLPFVTIRFEGKNIGTTTDNEGKYYLTTRFASKKIIISFVGYETEYINVKFGKSQIINVKLKEDSKILDDIVVRAKNKYRNKDNPAVELIKKVIDNRWKNRREALDYFEYEKYEKIQFALSNISEKFKQKKALRKFQFVFKNIDTVKMPGKEVLPVYIKETLSDYYYRRNPENTKEIVKANKMVSFDGYLDDQGIMEYVKFLYQDVNIYDNNVVLLTNQFVSPIATLAPTFYKYYIMDTTSVNEKKCVKLAFFPRNKADQLFQGFVYVMLDSSYAVKKVELAISQEINLNWVKELKVVQEFEKIENKGWMLVLDEILIDFGLAKNKTGFLGSRSVSYKNYKINIPRNDSIYTGLSYEVKEDALGKPIVFWEKNRHNPLSKTEQGTYTTIDSVKNVPVFKRTMDIVMLLFSGFKDFGYYEIGPVNTFYSYNPTEGVRFRFGGRTTNKFSKKYNLNTYVAYGLDDMRYKYYVGGSISFSKKSIFEFPLDALKISYQDETKIPGQELQFVQEDNILLSIKRGVNDKLLYNKIAKIEYIKEFPSHFSYSILFEYMRQEPGGSLYYNLENYLQQRNSQQHINISQATITLRYAPYEQFYQGKLYRVPIYNKYPILQLQYTFGNSIIGNDYNYHNLKFSLSKRFFLSILGYTDVTFEAGKIFGSVPYPLLTIHRANQTYSYQIQSYNLMNFLEFVSEQYVSLNIDHFFNGLFFNKIPLFKHLKLREVMSCKILYGSVSDKNNPNKNQNLFKFPTDSWGTPSTYTLERIPYIEASIGISNIFKLFRIDFVQRFTYLDNPVVTSSGIRARFKLDF